MENRQLAEVDASGRDGTVYTFRLSAGPICALEEKLDMDVMQLFERLQKGSCRLGMVREFVKVAIVSNGNGALTNTGAEAVIDNVGVVPVLAAMTDSILVTFNLETKKNEVEPVPAAVAAVEPVKRKRGRPAGSGISKPAAN